MSFGDQSLSRAPLPAKRQAKLWLKSFVVVKRLGRELSFSEEHDGGAVGRAGGFHLTVDLELWFMIIRSEGGMQQ